MKIFQKQHIVTINNLQVINTKISYADNDNMLIYILHSC